MPQMQSERCMTQYYKTRYEESQRELRTLRSDAQHAMLEAETLKQQCDQLTRQHSVLLEQLSDRHRAEIDRAVGSECATHLLQRELVECESQLLNVVQWASAMETSRHLLVEEVKALRRRVATELQERNDYEALRDEALVLRDQAIRHATSQDARVSALCETVETLQRQLGQHRAALEVGRELSMEAQRVTSAQSAAAEEAEAGHKVELAQLRSALEEAERRAETSARAARREREAAEREAAQRGLMETALKEVRKRELRRVAASREVAAAAARDELRESLADGARSPSRSPTQGRGAATGPRAASSIE